MKGFTKLHLPITSPNVSTAALSSSGSRVKVRGELGAIRKALWVQEEAELVKGSSWVESGGVVPAEIN